MNINADFFEKMYQNNPDPWQFATNSYELNRYQRICEVIGQQKPNYIFEAGCSVGILTKQLAQIGKFVEAIDISPTAIALAQHHCNSLNNVHIHCHCLTHQPINSNIDLIILSEIGYYFDKKQWYLILKNIIETCTPPFYLLISHWLGSSSDHVLSADEVHTIVSSFNELHLEHSEYNQQFRLDYWMKK